MLSTSAFAATAALIGDPARANMLASLMDGRALTATELAWAAGITPQTASGHLAQLTEGGLLAMAKQGRHRFHRLASPAVAQMLESIMSVAAERETQPGGGSRKAIVVGPRDAALRHARTCYDHLAGRLAVAIADRLVERAHIELSADGGVLTEDGAIFLRALGVDLDNDPARGGKRAGGRIFCRPCLDWSERRPHIAGVLGAALCRACFSQGWLRRIDGARAVAITPGGTERAQTGLQSVQRDVTPSYCQTVATRVPSRSQPTNNFDSVAHSDVCNPRSPAPNLPFRYRPAPAVAGR